MRAFWRLSRYLRPYRLWAVLAPALMALEVAMDLMQPRLVQQIVDQGIARGDLQSVVRSGLWMVGAAIVGLGGGVGCTVFAVLASQAMGADLRQAMFRKVQSLSFGNLDRLQTGGLITRLTNDVNQVQDAVLMLLRIMVRAPLMLLGSLVMAIVTSPSLALLFVVLIPVVVVALIVIVGRIYPLFGEVQRRLDVLNSTLQENLAGARVVKAFARSGFEVGRFGTANDEVMAQNVRAARFGAVTMPFMMLAMNAGVIAAIWLGGIRVVGGSLTIGQVIAFINYLSQTLMSLMFVSMLATQLARAGASAERIGEVFASEPDLAPPALPLPYEPRGKVEFDRVTFAYEGSDEPALRDVSFVAEPGQTVAILGATGSGKSTLAHLIPRFYDATTGTVRLDGRDVREIEESALRRTVGIALQESVLFTGTIRDNICYGRADANQEEVESAARIAQADGFIGRLAEGYDAPVGQRGAGLSGGQKQRLAIARAILPNPPVLVLDDSTSAVDLRTEARIRAGLDAMAPGQTRIVIAQRIGSVETADRILVLEDGRIAAQGTHPELMESSPIYREIYDSQMGSGGGGVLADE